MQRPPADADWMAAVIALSLRGRPAAAPNPNVGCLLVKGGRVVGRAGWHARKVRG
jgi:diaminohydroxyphosphoribosylaminopyrimidine deaminase / 5-amino-6-(5-phosphoribosylamino)uracil reductase